VQNDLLRAVDTHGGAVLVLLDLSAAFDTIDHNSLLKSLEKHCGLTGSVLKWFASYLSNRFQAVKIGQTVSDFIRVIFGVPQGSVLGPILFTLLTAPLGAIINLHGLFRHFYADDTQLYVVFNPRDSVSKSDAIAKMEACASDIKLWMTNNFLKLNEDKTELIIITSKQMVYDAFNIIIGNNVISPSSPPPRNLGVYIDSHLSMDYHVTMVSRSINAALFKISKIRKYLDTDTCNQLINGLMLSRLDYCNSLLYGANDAVLNQLQLLQKRAARVLTFTPKFDHITPILKELHWLPVQHRISFKILLLSYKCLHDLAPAYLSDLLHPYIPARNLRSSDPCLSLLTVPRSRTGFGDRSFEVAAPTLWNSIPPTIKNSPSVHIFKKNLKTYLFHQAFPT